MPFLPLPLETSSAVIAEGMIRDHQGRGYPLRESDPFIDHYEVLAEAHADARAYLVEADRGVFRDFGQLLGRNDPTILPDDGARATVTATLTTSAATTVPAGTRYGFPGADRDSVTGLAVFELTQTLAAEAAGSYAVELRSLDVGANRNGLDAQILTPVDDRASVTSMVTTAASSGGADAETDVAYLDRLVAHLALSSSRAVLPPDFAVVAAAQASVHRAVAIDLYDPAQTPPTGRAGHVSVATVDVTGRALSPDNAAAVEAELVRRRGVNVTPHVIGPTFTPVAVTFSFVPLVGRDPNVVRAAAESRVRDLIDPARYAGGDERPPAWRERTTIRLGDVIAVLEGTDGLDHTVTGTVQLNGQAADLVIAGPAGLPAPDDAAQPSTVVGTIAS